MREVQSSEVKARLPEFLNEVERGETIIITRHGKPIAHLTPAATQYRDRVHRALAKIAEMRKDVGRVSVEEILAARHEGHKY